MYNEDFLQKVIYERGMDEAIIFCQIESEKFDKEWREYIGKDPIALQELQYERDWWAERAQRLKNDESC